MGTCTALPKGVEDLVNHCEINTACDGASGCTLAMNIGHFGDPCPADAGCFNGVCQAGFCKLANGDPCAEDIACGSNHCVNHRCMPCIMDTDCPNVDAVCTPTGSCTLPGGAPCATNADCSSQTCGFLKFCFESGSETCTAAGCSTHYCSGGVCESCPNGADCPSGTKCSMGGSCLAPPGAFCTASSQCASGACGPAGLLDFPKCQ